MNEQITILDKTEFENRDLILETTNKTGIMTRPAWVLMNELEPFKGFPSMDLATAKSLYERIINIPSSPGLV